jgi:L-methionine (R)-S-oxide reductase
MHISKLKESITANIDSNKTVSEKLQFICNLLSQEIEYYDWVGFYFKNGKKKELKLAEFSGEPTEHTIIPFGKGICGQVAVSNENFVVPNVEDQDNYISCGFKVKSEIVIPIFVDGKNIGQIDIDSHTVNPFSENDELLLEFVCEKVAEML